MGRRVQGGPSVSPRVRAGTTEIPERRLTLNPSSWSIDRPFIVLAETKNSIKSVENVSIDTKELGSTKQVHFAQIMPKRIFLHDDDVF